MADRQPPATLLQTRPGVIEQHVLMATTHSGLSMEKYAIGVVQAYHARTPDHLRSVAFDVDRADPYAAARANAQKVRRMFFGGPVRMAAELEESLVLALPEPFRSACQRELAERYGLLAAKLPSGVAGEQVQHVAELITTAGDALAALAPVLSDGVIDADDAAGIPAALERLEAHLATVTTLVHTLRAHGGSNNVELLRVRG